MSRNVRHKSFDTPTKKPMRKGSKVADTSSDDDYAGVDLISDSEEDEPDVEVAEEQAIIASEEEDEDEDLQSTPRPSIDDDQSSWDGFGDSQEDFFEDHIARGNVPDQLTEASAWSHTLQSDSRRVRFEMPGSSSGESELDEDNFFQDIFVEETRLDPQFRAMIHNNDDNDDLGGSSDGSCWDFHGDYEASTNAVSGDAEVSDNQGEEEAEDEGEDEDSDSEGYESDGDTTDEDLPPAAFISRLPAQKRQPQSVLRESSSDSSEDVPVIPRRGGKSRPRLAQWIHTAKKPYATMNTDADRIIMFPSRIGRRYSLNDLMSRPDLVLQSWDAETPGEQTPQQSSPMNSNSLDLMLSNSANLMMGAMFNPYDDFILDFSGQALGPPEAFYPWTTVDANGNVSQDSTHSNSDSDGRDIGDGESVLSLDDIIVWGGESSDEEEGTAREDAGEDADAEDDLGSTTAEPASTPARPSNEDHAHHLLKHFDNRAGLVGSFRQNQTRHQLISRNLATQDSLAFSNPYNHGTIRGIKGDRLRAANTPITPARKQKAKTLVSSPGSPLAAAAKKRKFSGEQQSHKRTRSMN